MRLQIDAISLETRNKWSYVVRYVTGVPQHSELLVVKVGQNLESSDIKNKKHYQISSNGR